MLPKVSLYSKCCLCKNNSICLYQNLSCKNGQKWPKMLSLARIRTCNLQTAKKMNEIQTNALSFYRSQNVLGRSKFFLPDIYLHIVAVTNILCQTKRWFAFSKIGFCAGTIFFEEALNFWAGSKNLDPYKTFWDLYKDKA